MNVTNTYLKIFLYFLLIIIIVWIVVCATVEYIIIPKIIIPKIKEYIEKNFSASVKLSINDISFHPFKGFLLEDIKLSGPLVIENDYILYAKEADIDLALMSLVRKKIEIRQFKINDVQIEISRNKEGEWNFQPLVDIVTVEEHNVGSFSFVIKEFLMNNCSLVFIDYFNKDNALKREYTDINIILKNLGGSKYHLSASGGDPDKSNESVGINLSYNESLETIEGEFALHTEYLSLYWNYYLDEIMSPWELDAESVDLDINFTFNENILSLKGKYSVNKGDILHGDIKIKGNAFINQELEWVKGESLRDSYQSFDLSLDNISLSAGKYLFFENGICNAIITKDAITFENISGIIWKNPVSLSGKFIFAEPKELNLYGKIDEIESNFKLKMLSENSAAAEGQFNIGSSSLELQIDIGNLKELEFISDVKANVDLIDIFKPEFIKDNNINGNMQISGNVKGEVENVSSLNGQAVVIFRDFSIWDLEPLNSIFKVIVKNGILSGNIERTSFYDGTLNGLAHIDINKWGLGIYIDKLDLKEFTETIPDLKGVKGIATINISNIAKWANIESGQGGGYFKFQNLSLWNAEFFSKIKTDVENASNISLPANFKLVEGNFRIDKEGLSLENVYCDIEKMDLNIKGSISSSGTVDFTAGIVFSKGGILRTVRQIIIPVTIVFDAIANSIEINVYGKWPDLEHRVGIQPMSFFSAIFPVKQRGDPKKYTLEKFLEEK